MASQVIISATTLLGHNGIMPQAPGRQKMLRTIVHCSVPRPVSDLLILYWFLFKEQFNETVCTILYTY